MIRWFYKHILHPLAFGLLAVLKPLLSQKTQEMVTDKNRQQFHISPGLTENELVEKSPIWIHASSGEIEYAKPILRKLRETYPECPILVTHSSPSAKKILRDLKDVAAWGPLPWDTQKDCERFLVRWKPRVLLIARTDVWPVIAEACKKRNIPSLLFSATFAENSSRLRGISKYVTTWALSQLSEIHCVSKEDLQELKVLNLKTPATAQGDTRFDQVFHRLQNPKPLRLQMKPSGALPVFVAGSTWSEDEAVLIPAFQSLCKQMRFILVPHEVDEKHLSEIKERLTAASLTYSLYSQGESWESEVLIVDQIGILAELYTWGDLAFVGGSFRKQVHSVMEPLAAGLPVFVGPYHTNNREALYFKKRLFAKHAAVTEVTDSKNLVENINVFLKTDPSQFATSLQNEMQSLTYASSAVLKWYKESGSNK